MGERGIYHERQRLQFCLLHALNNLVQEQDSFSRAELDAVADKLSHDDPEGQQGKFSLIFKPHHNTLTGNYDVNVLIGALEARGKRVVWHDRRKGASSIDFSSSDGTLMGILLNVPVRRLGGLWRSRHWIALRKVAGSWYNLDSDRNAPQQFDSEQDIIAFIDGTLNEGAEAFLIMQEKQ